MEFNSALEFKISSQLLKKFSLNYYSKSSFLCIIYMLAGGQPREWRCNNELAIVRCLKTGGCTERKHLSEIP